MKKLLKPSNLFVFFIIIAIITLITWSHSKHDTEYSSLVPYENQNDLKKTDYRLVAPVIENNLSNELFSRIIYNRVGKCGSRSLQSVISVLAKRNHFEFYISSVSNNTRPPILDLQSEIKLINSLKGPMLYSRHIHFINFPKFGAQYPIYINMIRDPIERFSSQYHFKRNGDLRHPGFSRFQGPWKTGEKELDINECVLGNYTECQPQKLWYIIPYFCGQDLVCRRPSTEALQRAKRHLLDNYLVVGFLEDFDDFLQVLEKLLPYHFEGASKIWKEVSSDDLTFNNTSTFKKSKIRPEVRAVLRKRMALDYDFYNFARHVYKNLKSQINLQ